MRKSCLAKPTATLLPRLHEPPSKTIQYDDVVIGVLTAPPPANFVLPAGLKYSNENMSILEADHQPQSLELVTLRFKTTTAVSESSMLTLPDNIRKSDILTINDQPFEANLEDLVDQLDVAHHAQVYHAPFMKPTSLTLQTGQAAVILPIDALAYVPLSATKEDILNAIADSVSSVIRAILGVSSTGSAQVTHYRVLGAQLAVTLVTPSDENENDEEAVTRRQALHRLLCLPTDRPFFRKFNEGYVPNVDNFDGGCSGRLANVHHGIKGHGLGEGVTEHIVDGMYLYCHYMQDRFNDSGWGCAYRSMQTILSWCELQNYVHFKDGNLPTHKQIQEALVAVGDKPPTFVGSKEWIGANEVCYALEELTGVSSKILHVSRGSDMESKGRELAKHFDEQSTPIMVGGGVLAWTILGVARNNRTGRTKFLILDPHYEGRDDLKTIQSKGWIGWKAADVFKPDAFYNLCMPLRPSGV